VARTGSRVFAFLSAPLDTLALSPFPLYSLVTVWSTTASKTRAPPRSLPSSRRRRSPTCGAPPPKCSLSCQCPLTHAPAISLPPIPYSLGFNDIGAEGATALAAILKETQITNLGCATARVFAFVSMPIDTLATLSPSRLLPSSAVSVTTTSEPRAPPRSLPSSRRR
jgi:hypothetical protein